MARSKTLHQYNISRLNKVFMLMSVLMVVVVVGMVVEDHFRQWKEFQREFFEMEKDKLEAARVEAEEAISERRLTSAQEKLAESDSLLAENQSDLKRVDAELVAIGGVWYKRDQDFRFLKAEYDVMKYDYQIAEEHGDPQQIEKRAQEVRDTEAELLRRRLLREATEAERDSLQTARAEITKDVDKYQERIDTLTSDVSDVERQLAGMQPSFANTVRDAPMLDFISPALRIRQVLPPGLTYDINFGLTERVDRCQTCHLPIDTPGWEEDAIPFQSHPNLDLFVGSTAPHAIDLHGCTECHGGRPRGVNFTRAAHTPVDHDQEEHWEEEFGYHELHHWQWPMLRKGFYGAYCQKCHTGERTIEGAGLYNEGRELVEYFGCYGCHKIDGYEGLPKMGPSLTSVAKKLTADFAYTWINNPKAVRAHSSMPEVFNLENVTGGRDGDETYWERRTRAEINGIVAYLFEHSQQGSYDEPADGDADSGKALFESVGCQACHYVGDEEDAASPYFNPRRFGPNLESVATKTNAGWIYNWIKDPKSYDPTSRMPDMRLTDSEAADITMYLMTLTADSPSPYQPGPSDPEMVNEILTEYLSNTQSFATADAQLADLDEHEQEVLVGEKIISRQGCYGCHWIAGFEEALEIGTDLSQEGSKPIARFAFGNQHQLPHTLEGWLTHKMLKPRSFDEGIRVAPMEKARMPDFGMTPEVAEAVVGNLVGWTKHTVPLGRKVQYGTRGDYINAGEKLIAQRNCRACHLIEGSGMGIAELIPDPGYWPPNLFNEGAKVQPEWLANFLHDPSTIRPWMGVRMPTFGFSDIEIATLINYFMARAEIIDDPYPLVTSRSYSSSSDGEQLFTDYKCLQCHPTEVSEGSPSASELAPNLTLAANRLRPEWIIEWLKDPQGQMPGTRMPSFFYDDGEYFFDEAPDQMEAIRDYLMTLPR